MLTGGRNTINDGKPMLWREMAVACGHRNCLVAGEFLNFLNRRPCHCKPRAERVPV